MLFYISSFLQKMMQRPQATEPAPSPPSTEAATEDTREPFIALEDLIGVRHFLSSLPCNTFNHLLD